jgi:carbamoyltransferase
LADVSNYVLSFKPAVDFYGFHDPSAALFRDGTLVFGGEEERYTRRKHAPGTFPDNAIRACLEHAGIELSDVDRVVLPYDPELAFNKTGQFLKRTVRENVGRVREATSSSGGEGGRDDGDGGRRGDHPFVTVWNGVHKLKRQVDRKYFPTHEVRARLEGIGTPVPPIETQSHHLCHAVGAFHPSGYDEAVVLTIDGEGEYDSTVVWHADGERFERIRTYEVPNSLGHFFGAVTEYLGYRAFNGEGKVMGLAPYGGLDPDIESTLRDVADFSADYDVTAITEGGPHDGVAVLESLFDRPRNPRTDEFDQFEKDLAYTAQYLLEETVTDLVEQSVDRIGSRNVCLNGGVALNCKLNKRIMELDCVDDLFIQPVAHDGGLALGGGWLTAHPRDVEPMTNVYWGSATEPDDVRALLESSKLPFEAVDDVERYTAERIAEGALVGWVQGRQEMGPRALGNRSILADPRTEASRDRVNRYVKHREEWRPFAPSMLEERADEYLVNAEPSPYMIKTFDTVPENRDDIEAVIHPGDATTRPQTVRRDQNPRYYRLISEFDDITGVPVVLNTSFNDHGEPIVTTAEEAVADFYTMGLDLLVIGDYVVEKDRDAPATSLNS